MLLRFYDFVHESLGIHFWDIPALTVVLIIVLIAVLHTVRQKKRENDFEDEMKKRDNNNTNASGREGAL